MKLFSQKAVMTLKNFNIFIFRLSTLPLRHKWLRHMNYFMVGSEQFCVIINLFMFYLFVRAFIKLFKSEFYKIDRQKFYLMFLFSCLFVCFFIFCYHRNLCVRVANANVKLPTVKTWKRKLFFCKLHQLKYERSWDYRSLINFTKNQ